MTIVDGAQSGGQIPLNLHELEVDAYTISGQKWFGGLGGTGALFVRRGSLSQFQPTYGLDWAYDRIATLGRRCWKGLSETPGATVLTHGGPDDQMAGIICFNVDGWSSKAVSDALWERGFIVRHGEQPPCPVTVRVSTGWWNTEAEVDAIIGAVAALAMQPAS